MVNREEILTLLQSWERKYPVDQWEINGIHVWPILRVRLLFVFYNSEAKNATVNRQSKKEKIGLLKKFMLIIKGLLFWLKLAFNALPKVEYLFFSYSSYTDPKLGDLDKFCSQIIASLSGSSTLFQMKIGSQGFVPNGGVDLNPAIYILEILIYKLRKKTKFIHKLKQFEEFKNELLDLAPEHARTIVNIKFLEHQVRRISMQADFLEKIIYAVAPKAIFHVCYYNNFGINHAGFKNQIPVIDIQHGVLGSINAHYMGWSNKPKNGFNIMPSHFWCWSDEDAQFINTTNKTKCGFKGGNPLFKILNERSNKQSFPYSEETCILYTLQNRTEILPKELKKAILSSKKTRWLFRLHPAQRENMEQIIEEILAEIPSGNLDFDIANSWSVIDLIAVVDLHITGYSATIIEAAILGVNSIAIHPSARDYFNNSQYKDFIFYLNDQEDLNDLILHALEASNESQPDQHLISEKLLLKEIG